MHASYCSNLSEGDSGKEMQISMSMRDAIRKGQVDLKLSEATGNTGQKTRNTHYVKTM